ncbi:RNA polymerase sigma factor [Paracnuella aquatica]|uniref:RNA polymerase sigma factor n=1 Tax=Paracnuella aquatica TaxID=2268757 RepID=UPI001F4EF56B|nr:sigma-70 family RNA polymerase sigma factor [Paracnuella aquatica]
MKRTPYPDMTDAQLLDRFYESGDQYWLGILLDRYTLLLLGVCMKYLKNAEEARDCVQQIFLKVLTEAGKYRVDYFKSWLYMVAKNECLMRLRSKQGKQHKELDESFSAMPHEGEPTDWLAQEKTLKLLEESINELAAEQRTAVSLFYLQKKSYQQISEATGYTTLQVKSYIQNGKRNLRLMLERKLKKDRTS